MKGLIKRCQECKEYTLKITCPKCGSRTYMPHPPKFSLYDKYAKYRVADTKESDVTV